MILGAGDTAWLPRGWKITDEWVISDYAHAESYRIDDYTPPVGSRGYVIERRQNGGVETDQVFVHPSGDVVSASGSVGKSLLEFTRSGGEVIKPPFRLAPRYGLIGVASFAASVLVGVVLSAVDS